MQTNVDSCLTDTATATVDQHWLTLLHVSNHHQCIVSLSTTKWSNKYTFIYLIYIKTLGVSFWSTALPRLFGYLVGEVNFGLKIIEPSLTQSSQWLEPASESLRESILWHTWSPSWWQSSTLFIITFMWGIYHHTPETNQYNCHSPLRVVFHWIFRSHYHVLNHKWATFLLENFSWWM